MSKWVLDSINDPQIPEPVIHQLFTGQIPNWWQRSAAHQFQRSSEQTRNTLADADRFQQILRSKQRGIAGS